MAIYRMTFGGALFTDIWQCTLHMQSQASLTPDLLETPDSSPVLQDLQADCAKFVTALGVSRAATLTKVSINEIDPLTRRYVSATNSYEREFAAVRGPGSQLLPAQLSTALTLETGARRGLAARGRIFLPPINVQLGDSGHIESAARSGIATAGATFIRDLNDWPGLDAAVNNLRVIVLGRDGSTRAVTGVSVGSVVDTQRRRRSALKEVYTTLPI